MRIISSVSDRNWKPLSHYKGGTPVRFRCAFHQDNRPEDVFMVNSICSGYRPDREKYNGKMVVTKLSNGRVSYVDPDREVSVVDCHVRLEEMTC